jgi:hypothetical protein
MDLWESNEDVEYLHAPQIFTEDEQHEFFELITLIKTPTRFGANLLSAFIK